MTDAELIDLINKTVDEAISNMNKGIPSAQDEIFKEVQRLAKNLDYKNGKAIVSVKNIRIMGAITKRLRKIILSTDYLDHAKDFLKAFNTVTKLQNEYMANTTSDFNFGPVLKQIKFQAIADTSASLTEEGLTSGVVNRLRDVLRTNITTGGSFDELLDQFAGITKDTDKGQGILNKYVKQVTTDALNQYSRNYLQAAVGNTPDQWYQYTGSLITTSRDFCKAMVKKRWFNVKEIPALLAGEFPEFQDIEGKIDPKTKLPDGMIEGTNAANFLTFLGGYQCGHRAIPVPTLIVPKNIITEFKLAYPTAA